MSKSFCLQTLMKLIKLWKCIFQVFFAVHTSLLQQIASNSCLLWKYEPALSKDPSLKIQIGIFWWFWWKKHVDETCVSQFVKNLRKQASMFLKITKKSTCWTYLFHSLQSEARMSCLRGKSERESFSALMWQFCVKSKCKQATDCAWLFV